MKRIAEPIVGLLIVGLIAFCFVFPKQTDRLFNPKKSSLTVNHFTGAFTEIKDPKDSTKTLIFPLVEDSAFGKGKYLSAKVPIDTMGDSVKMYFRNDLVGHDSIFTMKTECKSK
jgi:hypothetical protein